MKKFCCKIKSEVRSRLQNAIFQTKRFCSFGIWLFGICSLVFGAGNLNSVYAGDKIVAIVNNDIITQKDLEEFTNFMRLQLSKNYNGGELEDKVNSMKQDLLEKLMEDRLILNEAKKNNIKIDENRIKAKINDIKKHYSSDMEFQQELTQQGLVQADLETRIREQLLMYGVIEQKIRDKITVRPDEVTDFYNNHKQEFLSPEEREVLVVTLENEDQANAFSFDLRNGKKLEDLSVRYPITVDKFESARIGELRKDIEDIVFKLGLGEVSRPIKIEDKFYIFRLDNIVPARQLALPEVQDKINAFLFEQKMQEKLANWLQELKSQSYIKVM